MSTTAEEHYRLEVIVSPAMLVAPGITGIPSIDARYHGALQAGQTIHLSTNEARALQGLPQP